MTLRPSFLALLVLAPTLAAQPEPIGPHRQSGPRVGVTYLAPGVVTRFNDGVERAGFGAEVDPAFPVVTQFGWQFEFQMFQAENGLTGVTEIVPLLSGLEHGLLVPTLSFIAGLRTPGGVEVGVGPNVTVSGFRQSETEPWTPDGEPNLTADVHAGLAVVVGRNTRIDGVSVPVNLAAVLGEGGARVSLLVGLNTSSRRY